MDAAALDRLVKKMTPPLSRYVAHRPFPKQSAFLLLKNFEAFYGGTAGAAKSDTMLMVAAQYMDVPGYAALVVRRTFTEASLPGALLERAKYRRNVLMGFAVYGDRPTGDKLSYASPLASALDADIVSMVIGAWNEVVLTEMELFMQGQIQNDTVDACSKGYRILTLGPRPLLVSPLPIR